MSNSLEEHYIARDEHQRIVEFYKSVVAHLFEQLRGSNSPTPRPTLDDILQHARQTAEQLRQSKLASSVECGGNVVDFRAARRERLSAAPAGQM